LFSQPTLFPVAKVLYRRFLVTVPVQRFSGSQAAMPQTGGKERGIEKPLTPNYFLPFPMEILRQRFRKFLL
jgi:hypothetical protein